jgi:phage shock protein A
LIERQRSYYRVSYGELIAPIVEAIQQQQQEIEAKRQQNAELRYALAGVEYQVSALKTENEALRHLIRSQMAQITAAR